MQVMDREKETLLFTARAIRGALNMQRGFLTDNIDAAKMTNRDAARMIALLIEQIEKLEENK
jgi:hypothetical protein